MLSVLSDRSIRAGIAEGRIVIDPLGKGCIQPASVDLRLDRPIKTFRSRYESSLDDLLSGEKSSVPDVMDIRRDLDRFVEAQEIPDPDPFILGPGQFILASTLERVELPNDIVARLEGKSSLGRLGLLVHATAGYVDPGFKGQLTLEISNVLRTRITLFYGMKISQISFLTLSTEAEHPYGSRQLRSKYQGQSGPVASREHLNFDSRGSRQYSPGPTPLKEWLDASQYAGSVSALARMLGAKDKTVENWVYGRNEPSAENRQKLYAVTKLQHYTPELGAEQGSLLRGDETQTELSARPDAS